MPALWIYVVQERSKRLEIRREGERKRREREEAEIETRRSEAEERARLKVRSVYIYMRRISYLLTATLNRSFVL